MGLGNGAGVEADPEAKEGGVEVCLRGVKG